MTSRRRRPLDPARPNRLQSGVRLEIRLLKVLKALAAYFDVSLSELLELLALQAFEGTPAFSKGTLKRIAQLKEVYGLDYTAEDARARLFTDRHR